MSQRQCLLCCLVLVLSCVATSVFAAGDADSDTTFGLYVGNSYCDFYVIPDQVEAMLRHDGQKADIRRETQGGFSWPKHWTAGKAQPRIRTEAKWDFVALQNHSMSAIEQREYFDEYGAKFIDLIRESTDADIYLYLTWARKNKPEMQATISEAYCTLAVEKDVKVAPVGIAFASWIEKYPADKHPEADILRDDAASHPNELGAYLSACVWYATITGKSPVGQLRRIEGANWLTKGDTLVDLDEKVALALQKHAWETVQSFDPHKYAKVKVAAE